MHRRRTPNEGTEVRHRDYFELRVPSAVDVDGNPAGSRDPPELFCDLGSVAVFRSMEILDFHAGQNRLSSPMVFSENIT